MNPTTSRGVFIEAACVALIAEATRWVAGAYDSLPASKIVGVSLIAVLTAVIAGYRAIRTLNTEPKNPRDELPKRPDNQPTNPPP